ncbi:MAG: hypothetical protein Q8L34_05265 [Candidatus Woesearchaeota archaeon]|nr:hypothetical protein [Candidatus Woesearchaeota archaeon]
MQRGNMNNSMLFSITFALLLAGFFASSYEDSITGQAFGRSSFKSSYRSPTYYQPPQPVVTTVSCTEEDTFGQEIVNGKLVASGSMLKKGMTVLTNSRGQQTKYEDKCISSTQLTEYWCTVNGQRVDGSLVKSDSPGTKGYLQTTEDCAKLGGRICTDGKCQLPPSTNQQQKGAFYTLTCSTYRSPAWTGITVKATFTDTTGKVTALTERPYRNTVCEQSNQLVYTCSKEGGSLTVQSSDAKPLSLQNVYTKIPQWASPSQSPLVKAAITPCTSATTPPSTTSASSGSVDYGVTCTTDTRGYTTTLVYERGMNGDPASLTRVAEEVIAPTCSPGTSGPSQTVSYRPCGERSTALVTQPTGTAFTDTIRLQLRNQVLGSQKIEICMRTIGGQQQVGVCAPGPNGGCIA